VNKFELSKERKENNKIMSFNEIMVTFTTGADVVLKTVHDSSYVRVGSGGSDAEVDTQTYIGALERFVIEPISGESGVYSLRSTFHGTYLRANEGASAKVDTQTYVGKWEKFRIEPAPNETGVYFIRTWQQTYLRAGISATVDTQASADYFAKFRINTIIDVGVSSELSRIVSLPKPLMLVSSKAANRQDPAWEEDTFDVAVIGRNLVVSILGGAQTWEQVLILEAIENPKWRYTITVGPASESSPTKKEVELPSSNMEVSPYPVNVQEPEWNDSFKVDVVGKVATVTRLDSDLKWGQNLILYVSI
jgi:hypothetical protein